MNYKKIVCQPIDEKSIDLPSIKNMFVINNYGTNQYQIINSLKHYLTWLSLLNDESELFLILNKEESDDFYNNVQIALNHHSEFDLCLIKENLNDDLIPKIRTIDNELLLNIPSSISYLVSKEGINKILNYVNIHGFTQTLANQILRIQNLKQYEISINYSNVQINDNKRLDFYIEEDDFIFYPQRDINGHDHSFHNTKYITELKKIAMLDDNIKAFNTFGYCKKEVVHPSLFTLYPISHGLYIKKEKQLGFIILRHVNSIETNQYWISCYNSIRRFYNNDIIIIDDNSNYDYITNENLINCKIIQSEFPGRGELLPYYYMYKLHLFDRAIILHDSTYFNKKINFPSNECLFLWHFDIRDPFIIYEDILPFLNKLDNTEYLISILNDKKWNACFGIMTIINYNILVRLEKTFNFFQNIMPCSINRFDRMMFERIFSLILHYIYPHLYNHTSLLGHILYYMKSNITFKNCNFEESKVYVDLPLVKFWSGR